MVLGGPFFFWYRSLAWPVSFGQDLLRACVKLNLIWMMQFFNPTWCRFFLSRDDIPVICYWIVIPKTLMKRNTVLAGWEHFDSRLESSRSFEHLWSDLFVKLGIRHQLKSHWLEWTPAWLPTPLDRLKKLNGWIWNEEWMGWERNTPAIFLLSFGLGKNHQP